MPSAHTRNPAPNTEQMGSGPSQNARRAPASEGSDGDFVKIGPQTVVAPQHDDDDWALIDSEIPLDDDFNVITYERNCDNDVNHKTTLKVTGFSTIEAETQRELERKAQLMKDKAAVERRLKEIEAIKAKRSQEEERKRVEDEALRQKMDEMKLLKQNEKRRREDVERRRTAYGLGPEQGKDAARKVDELQEAAMALRAAVSRKSAADQLQREQAALTGRARVLQIQARQSQRAQMPTKAVELEPHNFPAQRQDRARLEQIEDNAKLVQAKQRIENAMRNNGVVFPLEMQINALRERFGPTYALKSAETILRLWNQERQARNDKRHADASIWQKRAAKAHEEYVNEFGDDTLCRWTMAFEMEARKSYEQWMRS